MFFYSNSDYLDFKIDGCSYFLARIASFYKSVEEEAASRTLLKTPLL